MTETFYRNDESPLNPSDLKVETKNTTVALLVEMLESDLIELQPAFQRKAGLWSEQKQRELIESIALQLPLPSFYFYVDAKRKKWIVIDGLQRLTALKSFFVENNMLVEGLEIVKSLNGRRYSDLSFFERTSLKIFPVTLNVISGNVSPFAVSLIFKRVNSSGTPLSPAEVRNALFQGSATRLIQEMIELPAFIRLVSNNIDTDRMTDRDYANRFLAFLLGSYEDYSDSMDLFLSDAMKFINSLPESSTQAILGKFSASLNFCESLLGADAFRLPKLNSKERKHPVSKAMFDMLTVSFAHLSEYQKHLILKNKAFFVREYQLKLSSPQFRKSFASNMATTANIRLRFETIESLLKSFSRQ